MSPLATDGAQQPTDSRGSSNWLAGAGAIAFLLLMVALVGPIAPMGIATALAATLMLSAFLRKPRPEWPRTPMSPATVGWLVALVVVSACALDPTGSFPRVKKAFMPLLVPLAAYFGRDARQGRRALAVYLVAAGQIGRAHV